MVPRVGFELTVYALQVRCITVMLSRHMIIYRTIQRIIKVTTIIIKILGGIIIYFVVTPCSISNSFTLEYVLSCKP